MMKTRIPILEILIILLASVIVFSCQDNKKATINEPVWKPYNDSLEVLANQDHEELRMRYKLIQSKVLDKNAVFIPLYEEVSKMSENEYELLRPLILEKDIPTIQSHIAEGNLSYEKLVLFYLYRIYKYELDNKTTLNTIIALNENVVKEAREADGLMSNKDEDGSRHPIYGMPILLKDNINAKGMNTTAGSIALVNNKTNDSFISERLKEKGALILGKVNLSEWAYYLCKSCPLGYSAVGGQTLNPYGRRIFETGGSSSGSGTSVAANYAVAAVGTETSGSILSPSSKNSVVGLKPTIGLLSRTGIVPISSTLDTPGPMTKNVKDNAILLDALFGFDAEDKFSVNTKWSNGFYYNNFESSLKGKRFGAIKSLLESDSIYKMTIAKIQSLGAEVVEFMPPEVTMDGFLNILNIDMRNDLPEYIKTHVENKEKVTIGSIADAIEFNGEDSLVRIPYGQALFKEIISDSTSAEELERIKSRLEKNGRIFFDTALDQHNLDAVLSINNYHAGYAAVAKYPALTVPMGYKENGEPINLTFIGKPFSEKNLLELGYAFEQATKARKLPEAYRK